MPPSQQSADTRNGADRNQLSRVENKLREAERSEDALHDLKYLTNDFERVERMTRRRGNVQAGKEAVPSSSSVFKALRRPKSIRATSSLMKIHNIGQPKGRSTVHYTISRDATWCDANVQANTNDNGKFEDSDLEIDRELLDIFHPS